MDALLLRSAEFEKLMTEYLTIPPAIASKKSQAARIMCSVAFEHSESIKILLATGNFTSATGLLRLQFEALVRAHWFHFAATDIQIEKHLEELTYKSATKNSKAPMLSEMLQKMEGKAPKNALDPLLEFKQFSWKPLSSYVHGGIHAINRHSQGYPIQLLELVLRNSNGLNGVTAYFWSHLTGQPHRPKEVMELFKEFRNCLPPDRLKNLSKAICDSAQEVKNT
ncbi:hypothetical protein [Shewanella sp. Isolate8]|uniref:DUF6988 family protein n=1 Tax=Shewanella sp. Isolate8 TaxID=2908529 RepID=UPI001EFDBA65|nr:hypothetical protein [Shewanella sp. Isolate8]MCG9747562.1 hypothetical protein [Shewanella sp. Isolate8]